MMFVQHLNAVMSYHVVPCASTSSWGGVRLSALGTLAAIWPIVPAPIDR
jgi:hypothetical protein